MSRLPLISVFIPAYNAVDFVGQAIESVLAQTYQNYELIIINDASTDGTAEVINQYQGHPAVRIYHNAINLGVSGNWRRGVSMCRGDYIVRLDADDFYAPSFLQKAADMFREFPDADLVFTGTNLLYKDGKVRQDLPYKENWVRPGLEFLPEILRTCRIWSPSACVRRACYEKLGGVIEEMSIHEDWELWVRITANGRIGYIAEALTNIRILNANGCTTSAITKALSPLACDIWLTRLAAGQLPYQLNEPLLMLLKQGMYDINMAFAVFAMEAGLSESVESHLAFASQLLPAPSKGPMLARLHARAAEIYFMEGGHYFKGWQFLLQSLRLGLPFYENGKSLKLWARAFLGKTVFELLRKNTVGRRRFPYVMRTD